MRLRSLKIQDFLSHAHTVLEFRDEVLQFQARNWDHIHEGWSNGGGKSSAAIYPVTWALWGRIPVLTETKDEIIRHNQDEVKVELKMAGSDGSLEIVRSKARGKAEQLAAWFNGQRVPGERDECQANLEKLYGISWEVYNNTIYLGPDSPAVQFVDAQPSKRAALLGELVNLGPFTDAWQKAVLEISTMERRQLELVTIHSQLGSQLVDIEAQIQRIGIAYQVEQTAHQARSRATTLEISTLEKEAMGLQERLKNPPSTDVTTCQAAVNDQEEFCQRLQSKASVLKAKIQMARPGVGSSCPSCNQPITEAISSCLHTARTEWGRDLELANGELSVALATLQRCRDDRDSCLSWVGTVFQIHSRLEDIKGLIYKTKTGLENRTIAVLHSELEKAKANRAKNQEQTTTFQKELAGINDKLPIIQTISKGFKNDIRNLLLDDIRVGLHTHTSEYLQILAENEFTIRFPPTSQTGQEKFVIQIWVGANKPITSPGEKYRAKLAILLALRRVLQHQQVGCLDFLLIDDPLLGCDVAGEIAFSKLVEVLSLHQPQILITVPKPVEGLTAKVIFVERTGRVSRCLN